MRSLRKKCPYSELLWSVFTRIRTEYREARSISPYSVRMWENTDQNNSEYGHFSRSHLHSVLLSPVSFPVRKYLWKVCDIWRDIPGFTEYLTAWKVSKYRVFSGSYFPVFSSNTGICVPKKTPHLDTSHAMSLHLKSKLRQLLLLLLWWWWCRFIAFAQAVLNPEIFLLSEL